MPTATTHPNQHTPTWSFHQAWQRARVPDKAARSLHQRGLIPDTNLTAGDILTLRAVTATSRFGSWTDLPAAISGARDQSLQYLCHDLANRVGATDPTQGTGQGNEDSDGGSELLNQTLAVVLPQVAVLATPTDFPHTYFPHVTALILPVGYWAHCLRRDGRLPSEGLTP